MTSFMFLLLRALIVLTAFNFFFFITGFSRVKIVIVWTKPNWKIVSLETFNELAPMLWANLNWIRDFTFKLQWIVLRVTSYFFFHEWYYNEILFQFWIYPFRSWNAISELFVLRSILEWIFISIKFDVRCICW